MQAQFGERLTGLEFEVLGGVVAFLGRGVIGGKTGESEAEEREVFHGAQRLAELKIEDCRLQIEKTGYRVPSRRALPSFD
jgi:hypothetical protein